MTFCLWFLIFYIDICLVPSNNWLQMVEGEYRQCRYCTYLAPFSAKYAQMPN